MQYQDHTVTFYFTMLTLYAIVLLIQVCQSGDLKTLGSPKVVTFLKLLVLHKIESKRPLLSGWYFGFYHSHCRKSIFVRICENGSNSSEAALVSAEYSG